MRSLSFKTALLVSLAAALAVGGVVAKGEGWRINITGSLPGIFYKVSKHPGLGNFVQFCPHIVVDALPDAWPWEPSCNGKMPLLKKVVGTIGDEVVVDDLGVTINNTRLPDSSPKLFAMNGKPLPSALGRYVLKEGEFWAAGEHPDSFDSRYFGPASVAAIIQ